MKKNYRAGATGALLDEYERAISDLKSVIATISDAALTKILDPLTTDENCRSVQTILTHVVHSAYGYATSIHQAKGHHLQRPEKILRGSAEEYSTDLSAVFAFTENVFREIGDAEVEQPDESQKIKSGWGQSYDIEQLTEHAIVHILRHRRQIEKFKLLMNG